MGANCAGWGRQRHRVATLALPNGASEIACVSPENHPLWLRRLVGALWTAGWFGVLWAVHRPWGGLGGLVSERLRWFERFVLAAGLIVGSTLGDVVRSVTATRSGQARGARWLLYPAAVIGALGMAVLRLAGRDDPIGVVLNGLLSYTAGALSAYLGIGSACRGDRSSDRRSAGHQPD